MENREQYEKELKDSKSDLEFLNKMDKRNKHHNNFYTVIIIIVLLCIVFFGWHEYNYYTQSSPEYTNKNSRSVDHVIKYHHHHHDDSQSTSIQQGNEGNNTNDTQQSSQNPGAESSNNNMPRHQSTTAVPAHQKPQNTNNDSDKHVADQAKNEINSNMNSSIERRANEAPSQN